MKSTSTNQIINELDIHILNRQDLLIDDTVDLNVAAEKLSTEDGIYGLKDQNGLDSVLHLMNQEAFGRDYHPTIIDKASFLWYEIARRQLFHNGNKRTALLSAFVFLRYNFFRLSVDNAETLYKVSVDIAEGKMSQAELKDFILKNSKIDFALMDEIEQGR